MENPETVLQHQENELEQKEKKALLDLADLGLELEDLKDRLVLDVGAGSADVSEICKKMGTNVVSLDRNPELWKGEGREISKGVPYIVTDSGKMPFKDKVFDLIISHGGPPNIQDTKEKVTATIKEFERVLKEGGEARFGCGSLHAGIFSPEELFTPEENENFTTEQRIQRIRKKAIDFLKSVVDKNYKISQKETKKGRIFAEGNLYYVLKKMKPR